MMRLVLAAYFFRLSSAQVQTTTAQSTTKPARLAYDCAVNLVAFKKVDCGIDESPRSVEYMDKDRGCIYGQAYGTECGYGRCTNRGFITLDLWKRDLCLGPNWYSCQIELGKCYNVQVNDTGPCTSDQNKTYADLPAEMRSPDVYKSYRFGLKYPEGCKEMTLCYDSEGKTFDCHGGYTGALQSKNKPLYKGPATASGASTLAALIAGLALIGYSLTTELIEQAMR